MPLEVRRLSLGKHKRGNSGPWWFEEIYNLESPAAKGRYINTASSQYILEIQDLRKYFTCIASASVATSGVIFGIYFKHFCSLQAAFLKQILCRTCQTRRARWFDRTWEAPR